jgi:iron complex outermembrane receptor protein
VPASVTVIEREEIEAQEKTSRTLGEMLGKLVPGLATGVGSQTNWGQTLRGRNMLVLIDGVPQTTIRNASRDLYTIDPAAVERVEIIRGASAVYGQGGAGGVINIITKAPTKQGTEFTTEVGAVSSLTHIGSESLGGWLRQGASGRRGAVDYTLSAALEHVPGAYDADGDRIPPDPSQGDLYDTDSLNLLGKLGWSGDNQRLEFTANTFRSRQDTEYVSDPAVNAEPAGTVPARAKKGLQLEDQGETDNDLLNLSYRHDAVLGSQLQSQLYYRDYYTRFFPFDGRRFAAWNAIAQSYVESQVWGGRLALDTPLLTGKGRDVSLLWGADYADETTEQRVTTFDEDVYDASGGLVFRPTGDRGLVPPLHHEQLGLFAQLEWALSERWTVRGGARHERVRLEVDDFVTLGQGNQIEGGTVDYSDTVFNLGAIFHATDAVHLFASYSEGFSLPDIGLILRAAPPDFEVSRSNLEPIEVKNYEIGSRGDWKSVQSSLSLFYSTSDEGVSSNGFAANVVRAPERTYGLEATLDVYPSDTLAVGGSFTWIEGEHDPDRDGDYTALNGWRIPPPKLTAYVEHQTQPGWSNRLQVLYSGSRDRAAEDGVTYGGREVESFVVVDLLSTLKAGPGSLGIGVENLFNEDYYNVYSQLLVNGRNETHFKAPGRTLRLSYTVNY